MLGGGGGEEVRERGERKEGRGKGGEERKGGERKEEGEGEGSVAHVHRPSRSFLTVCVNTCSA